MIVSANLPVVAPTLPPKPPDPSGGAVDMIKDFQKKLDDAAAVKEYDVSTKPGGDSDRDSGTGYQGPEYDVSTKDIPFAPGPSCPEGERLYKVVGTKGTEYIYADPGATKEQIQERVGFAGFVTSVMSPEAYDTQPDYKVVTTVDGREVQVPWDLTKEAKAEYSRIHGIYPKSSDEEAMGVVSGIATQLRAGTWTPVYELPVVKDYAQRASIPAVSALSEIRNILAPIEPTGQIKMAGAAPFGLTDPQAQIIQSWFRQTGQPEVAETFATSYLAATGSPTSQVRRAIALEYGPFEVLKDFQGEKEGEFRIVEAIASVPESEQEAFSESLYPYFGEGLSKQALIQARILDKVGTEVTVEDLGNLLSVGTLTEEDIATAYSPSTVDEVKRYCSEYGCGLVTMGVGDLGTTETPKGIARISWDPIGAGIPLQFYDPTKREYNLKVLPYEDWVVNYGGRLKRFTTKGEAIQWAESQGYQVQIGVQTSIDMMKETIFQLAQTPEATLVAAGLFQASPALQALSVAPAAQLTNIVTTPIKVVGHPLLSQVLTRAVGVSGSLIPATWLTTEVGLVGGLGYKPESAESRAQRAYVSLSEPQKQELLADYLSRAGAEYDKVYSELGPNQTIGVTRTEFLTQATSDFDPALRAALLEKASESMALQPGVEGWVGRAGELLSLPAQALGSAPIPGAIKSVAGGVYQLFAPLTVATALYPEKGPAAFTTMIPYYGPITAATALQWGELTHLQRAAGIGFTILPAASPIIGAGFRGLGRKISESQARWEATHMTAQEILAKHGAYPQAGYEVLPDFWRITSGGSIQYPLVKLGITSGGWRPTLRGGRFGYQLTLPRPTLTHLRPSRFGVPEQAWDLGLSPVYRAIPNWTGKGWTLVRRGSPVGWYADPFQQGAIWQGPSEWPIGDYPSTAYTPTAFHIWDPYSSKSPYSAGWLTRRWAVTPDWAKPTGAGSISSEPPWRSVESDWRRASAEANRTLQRRLAADAKAELAKYEPGPWERVTEKQAEGYAKDPAYEVSYDSRTGSWVVRQRYHHLRPQPAKTAVVTSTVTTTGTTPSYSPSDLISASTPPAMQPLGGGFYIARYSAHPAVQIPEFSPDLAAADVPVRIPGPTVITDVPVLPQIGPIVPDLTQFRDPSRVTTYQVEDYLRTTLEPAPAESPAGGPEYYPDEPYTEFGGKPPTKFRFPLPPFGVPSLGTGGSAVRARRGRLMGTSWLMPGLSVHFPDPFGTGKLSYSLVKPRARRYGARTPRVKLGSLKV